MFDSIIAEKLTKAAEAVRMTLRDHIIRGDGNYYSFKENKKLEVLKIRQDTIMARYSCWYRAIIVSITP